MLPPMTFVKSEVFCTVIFEAIHNWPGVVNFKELEEVHYLQYPHRHRFFFKAHSKVTHSDRDVEFIWLAHRIEEFLLNKFPDRQLGAMSCEMLGELILNNFPAVYKVEVSEDNENGAVMERVERVVGPAVAH